MNLFWRLARLNNRMANFTVKTIEERTSANGSKYHVVRFDEASGVFFAYYGMDGVKAGDKISGRIKERVFHREKSSAGYPGYNPEAMLVSYAKDLMLAGFEQRDAIHAISELIRAFGRSRDGCMFVSYAKDLLVAGKCKTAVEAAGIIAGIREALAE